jgi:hypothetical protein
LNYKSDSRYLWTPSRKKKAMEEAANPDSACTLCSHDLDHYALLVSPHPNIPVPVCFLCLEEVTEKLNCEIDQNDRCSWCGHCDKGSMFICGDGNSCEHSFCSDCLEENLGAKFVSDLNSEDEDWLCLACNSQQVSHLTVALKACQAGSIYSRSSNSFHAANTAECTEAVVIGKDALPLSLSTEGESIVHEEGVNEDVARLKVVLEEGHDALVRLEAQNIAQQKQLIREEYEKDDLADFRG